MRENKEMGDPPSGKGGSPMDAPRCIAAVRRTKPISAWSRPRCAALGKSSAPVQAPTGATSRRPTYHIVRSGEASREEGALMADAHRRLDAYMPSPVVQHTLAKMAGGMADIMNDAWRNATLSDSQCACLCVGTMEHRAVRSVGLVQRGKSEFLEPFVLGLAEWL